MIGNNVSVSSVSGSTSAITSTVVTTNTLTSAANNAVMSVTTATVPVNSSVPIASVAGTTQDVKWNAAPTLLERQRENLTARLRREFGLCVSDDDEDKSGKMSWLRVSLCVGLCIRAYRGEITQVHYQKYINEMKLYHTLLTANRLPATLYSM